MQWQAKGDTSCVGLMWSAYAGVPAAASYWQKSRLSLKMLCRPLLGDSIEETDVQFATRLTKEAGVTVIPVSLHLTPWVNFGMCTSSENNLTSLRDKKLIMVRTHNELLSINFFLINGALLETALLNAVFLWQACRVLSYNFMDVRFRGMKQANRLFAGQCLLHQQRETPASGAILLLQVRREAQEGNRPAEDLFWGSAVTDWY